VHTPYFILLIELSCGLSKDNFIDRGVENIEIVGLHKSYIWGKACFQGPPLIWGWYPKGCRPLSVGYLVFLTTISSSFGEKTQNWKSGDSIISRTSNKTRFYERTSKFIGGFSSFLESFGICGYIHQTSTFILWELWLRSLRTTQGWPSGGFDAIFNTRPIHHIGLRIKGRLVGSRLQVQNKVRDKIYLSAKVNGGRRSIGYASCVQGVTFKYKGGTLAVL
jgi:hypothetical protein